MNIKQAGNIISILLGINLGLILIIIAGFTYKDPAIIVESDIYKDYERIEVDMNETQLVGDVEAPTQIINDVETVEQKQNNISDYELEMLCRITNAEAGDQGELGMRYVIDVILNRVHSNIYPNTIEEVITQQYQFEGYDTCLYNEDIPEELEEIVLEELNNPTNTEILYFRKDYYHSFGTPLFNYKDHYFSK